MKTLVLFVHGLGGNAKDTWGKFPSLIAADESLKNRVDIDFYEYPTSLFRLPGMRKALKIQTLAGGLKTLLENKFDHYDSITFACHSLGGLIARRYLIDELKKSQNNHELKCKHLLLFATPNNGSGLASIGQHISWKHNQLKQLCSHSDLIDDLNKDWHTFDASNKLIVKYISAGQDRIVSEGSSTLFAGNPDIETLPNEDHRSIVKPKDEKALAFLILRKFVLQACETSIDNYQNHEKNQPDESWLNSPPTLTWPFADMFNLREAFSSLITRQSPHRILLVEGVTERGKTSASKHLVGQAMNYSWLTCGRLDFKGAAGLEKEARNLCHQLNLTDEPLSTDQSSAQHLQEIFNQLVKTQRPTVLFFDTYEKIDNSDISEWLDSVLFFKMIRESWLRVIVMGRGFPDNTHQAWGGITQKIAISAPTCDDWVEYNRQYRPEIDPVDIRKVFDLSNGRSSAMYQVFATNKTPDKRKRHG